MSESPVDWQGQALAGLRTLTVEIMPAMELLYLDGLAAHLLGADAPEPPYTIEHGSTIVSLLLRALVDAPTVELDLQPSDLEDASSVGRESVVDGAQRFAQRGGPGVHQLVSRCLAATVGELEQHKEEPEFQVRSLFYYGLLAIASGPENQTNEETSESVLAAFAAWDERIGSGFVPPWRIVA